MVAKTKQPGQAGHGRLRGRSLMGAAPTSLTLGNLLCGFTAILLVMSTGEAGPESVMMGQMGRLEVAALLIFLGMLLDGLDGRVARLTGTSSRLGESLDSLADVISFGVAPAVLALRMARVEVSVPLMGEIGLSPSLGSALGRLAVAAACVYVACAALRLARYEAEDASEGPIDTFQGLPSPGAGGAIASLVLLASMVGRIDPAVNLNAPMLQALLVLATVVVLVLAGLAMVSRLPYVHVMNRYTRGGVGFMQMAIGAILLIFSIWFWHYSLSLCFVGYTLSAPLGAVWRAMRGKPIAEQIEEAHQEADRHLAMGSTQRDGLSATMSHSDESEN